MRALILTDNDGQLRDRDMLDLYDGFLSLGVPIKFYKKLDMSLNIDGSYPSKVLLQENDIVLGHVDMCRIALKHFGIKEPKVLDYPPQLKQYFHRSIRKMTSKQFIKILEENEEFGKTYFVKPVMNKLFTGFCCVTRQEYERQAFQVSNSAEVYVCSTIHFDAEYRIYVSNNKMSGVYRYWGDNWNAVVTGSQANELIDALGEGMPVFYSIDAGVTDKGELALVECNDGYALGNYGLSPGDYAKMSMERWQEMICNGEKVDKIKP